MLKPGTITRVLDFYFGNEAMFQNDLARASSEFFKNGVPDASEQGQQYFSEWFLHDFVLETGKKVLQDFYDRNPCALSEDDLQIYRDLQENEYSFFEVLAVRPDEGIRLRNIRNDHEIEVVEKQGTHDVFPSALMLGRVCHTGDHYEILGTPVVYGGIEFTARMRRELKKMPGKLTPKDAYTLVQKEDNGTAQPSPFYKPEDYYTEHPEKATERLQTSLEACGIADFVTIPLIQRWIANDSKKDVRADPIPASSTLLLGLAWNRGSDVAVKELLNAVTTLHNISQNTARGGKSPYELCGAQGQTKNNRTKDTILTDTISVGEWREFAERAVKTMKQGGHEKALVAFKRTFAQLLEERTTEPEIYRIYANTAVCHFACGEEIEGKTLLDISLTLNPNYDFARNMFAQYEQGEFSEMIAQGLLENMRKALKDKNHPMNRFDMHTLRLWDTDRLVGELAKNGISVSREGFREEAHGFVSLQKMNDELFYPCFTGNHEDEDMVWMTTQILWERWCPDLFAVEILMDDIHALEDVVYAKVVKKDELMRCVMKIVAYARSPKVRDICSCWRGFGEFISQCDDLECCFLELIGTECELLVREAAENFALHGGIREFEVVSHASDAWHEVTGWQKKLQNLASLDAHDYYPFHDLARLFKRKGNTALEEEYLVLALHAVKRREQLALYDLPGFELYDRTIYDDYVFVLGELSRFYRMTGEKEKVQEVHEYTAAIKKRKVELSYAPAKEKRSEKMWAKIAEHTEERMQKEHPALLYYQFLKPFGIQFATASLTTTPYVWIGASGEKKIGRNEPCPCRAKKGDGSPIKYKRCHGK